MLSHIRLIRFALPILHVEYRKFRELVRGSMSSENCIERMRLAQTHSNAETMMVGFQLALGDDTKEAEAISIIRESFHLFDVVNAKAFFGALVAK